LNPEFVTLERQSQASGRRVANIESRSTSRLDDA